MTTELSPSAVDEVRRLDVQKQSLELLERIANQLAQDRRDAIDRDIKLPLGRVVSTGVEHFPAKDEQESSGVLILAAGYISRVDSNAQLERIFEMMRVHVDNA